MLKLLFLIPLFFLGCDQTPQPVAIEQAKPTGSAHVAELQTPPQQEQSIILVETTAEAIPRWRQAAEVKPTLILFSRQPFLLQIPEAARPAALQLARSGTLADFAQRASDRTPDPLLHPDMALSMALEAGFFAKIIWVLPQQSDEELPSIESFREKLLETGSASQTEAESFVRQDQQIHGSLRHTPIIVTAQQPLGMFAQPALVHLDLSFFKHLYRNEIKTPLYPLVYRVMEQIQPVTEKAQSISISLSNRTGAVSLQVRFVGELLARLLHDSSLLQQPLNANDNRRHQALQLADFFKKEQRLQLTLEMSSAAPQDATVKYDLFQIAAEFNQGDAALNYLAEAVALDPVYALEYQQLAEQALEKKRPDAALQMLDLASAAAPDNPFLAIRKGEILLNSGHPELTENILHNLLQLPWSDIYYPGIRERLRQKFAAQPTSITPQPAGE